MLFGLWRTCKRRSPRRMSDAAARLRARARVRARRTGAGAGVKGRSESPAQDGGNGPLAPGAGASDSGVVAAIMFVLLSWARRGGIVRRRAEGPTSLAVSPLPAMSNRCVWRVGDARPRTGRWLCVQRAGTGGLHAAVQRARAWRGQAQERSGCHSVVLYCALLSYPRACGRGRGGAS